MARQRRERTRQGEGDGDGDGGSSSSGQVIDDGQRTGVHRPRPPPSSPRKVSLQWLAILYLILHSSWLVYNFQYNRLPHPLSALAAGKRGFSEALARAHVKVLTELGPHPVGSNSLDAATRYILKKVKEVEAQAPWDADVEIDYFHTHAGVNSLKGGLFKGKTLAYGSLKHVVVRIKPKSISNAEENAILISSHIDTVITSGGAGDCSSCISVMLELARSISQWTHRLRHAVIFLFNTGEEEGLIGAHGFITQHPWNSSIRLFVDLEAMGVGGRSTLFQGGSNKWILEMYAKAAKYPAAQILAQDIFGSGIVKSATDFQVYQEVANLPGLDFAFTSRGAVYHTKNDKLELLTAGSLQHLGENMLSFIKEVAGSSDMPNMTTKENGKNGSKGQIVYFDILGLYLVVYPQTVANQINVSILLQTLLLLFTSVFQGGLTSVIAFAISLLSLVLTWTFSAILTALVGLALPSFAEEAVPYIAHHWLAIGLFGAPALFGALLGHHIGYILLRAYLLKAKAKSCKSKEEQIVALELSEWEAERWLYKAGFVQWIGVLAFGTWHGVGSTYIAILWLVPPSVAYGIIDATFTPRIRARPLRTVTLLAGLLLPVIVSAGSFINLLDVMIGNLVRFDRNPGANPDWLVNVLFGILVAAIVCLFFIYMLPYAHRLGAIKWVLFGLALLFMLTTSLLFFNKVPSFDENTGKAINAVHVIESSKGHKGKEVLSSYISMVSLTPGKFKQELELLESEGFTCGPMDRPDFVTHFVKYGCIKLMDKESDNDALLNDLPTLKLVDENTVDGERISRVSIQTASSRRWVLAINTTSIAEFQLKIVTHEGKREMLSSRNDAVGVNGWHLIQFSALQNGPNSFDLSLFWRNATSVEPKRYLQGKDNVLLKLRTDVNLVSPKLSDILAKLPPWLVPFGKSTSPYPLCYLASLPVD